MYSYLVLFEKSEDGGYGAYAPDLPGCVAVGETIEDVQQAMLEAMEMHVRGLVEDGDAAPPRRHVAAQLFSVRGGLVSK